MEDKRMYAFKLAFSSQQSLYKDRKSIIRPVPLCVAVTLTYVYTSHRRGTMCVWPNIS